MVDDQDGRSQKARERSYEEDVAPTAPGATGELCAAKIEAQKPNQAKTGGSHDFPHWERRILAWIGVVSAVIAGAGLWVSVRQASINSQALYQVQRPFLGIAGIQQIPYLHHDEDNGSVTTSWGFAPALINDGNTPSHGTKVTTGINFVRQSDVARLTFTDGRSISVPSSIEPHETIAVGFLGASQEHFESIGDKAGDAVAIWVTVHYTDFASHPHVLEYCALFDTVIRQQPGGPIRSFANSMCPTHNCVDSECQLRSNDLRE